MIILYPRMRVGPRTTSTRSRRFTCGSRLHPGEPGPAPEHERTDQTLMHSARWIRPRGPRGASTGPGLPGGLRPPANANSPAFQGSKAPSVCDRSAQCTGRLSRGGEGGAGCRPVQDARARTHRGRLHAVVSAKHAVLSAEMLTEAYQLRSSWREECPHQGRRDVALSHAAAWCWGYSQIPQRRIPEDP